MPAAANAGAQTFNAGGFGGGLSGSCKLFSFLRPAGIESANKDLFMD